MGSRRIPYLRRAAQPSPTMSFPAQKWYGLPPRFAPEAGKTVIEPPGAGPGWWAGACSALYAPDRQRFYLSYRLRKPRELGRGVECRVAESEDGLTFRDVWRLGKEQLESPSVERTALVRRGPDDWQFYLSYVDPADQRWRIDVLDGPAPDRFDLGTRRAA